MLFLLQKSNTVDAFAAIKFDDEISDEYVSFEFKALVIVPSLFI